MHGSVAGSLVGTLWRGCHCQVASVRDIAAYAFGIGRASVFGARACGNVAMGSVAMGSVAMGNVAMGSVALGNVAPGSLALAFRPFCFSVPLELRGQTAPAVNSERSSSRSPGTTMVLH